MKAKYIEPKIELAYYTPITICAGSPPAIEGGTNENDQFPWQDDGTQGDDMDAKQNLWDGWDD